MEFALRRLHFGDVDVEEADRIDLEFPPWLLIAFRLRQSADVVALQAAMERRARQVRDRRLERVKAVVERQQGMPSEGDNHGLLLRGQDRRFGLPQALLTMLYRSTDRLRRRGAAV